MRLIEREIKPWVIFLFVGFVGLLTLGSIGWEKNRIVSKIIVKGNEVISKEKILELAGVKVGDKISSLNLSEIRERIERHNFIRRAEIYVSLPNALFIEVSERKPVAMLLYGGKIYYVDLDGKVISFDDVKKIFAVPILSGISRKVPEVDSVVEIKRQYEIIKVAIDEKVYELISEIRFSDGEFILLTKEGNVLVFLGKSDFRKKLILLREFWSQVVPGSGYPVYIDLRYDGKIYAKFN